MKKSAPLAVALAVWPSRLFRRARSDRTTSARRCRSRTRSTASNALAEARAFADVAVVGRLRRPVLKGLVEEALRNGFDVRLAAARVEEARARFGIARSEFFPSISYEAGWQRARADQLLNPSGTAQTRWTADVGLSWELDLWGRIRRLNESARAQYLATEEARRGVLLSLASEVAIAYLDLRELDAELEIAKRTAEAFQGTYDLFNRRLEGGAASALETARAEAALGEVAAQIPEIERAIVARENQINFLLGRNPQPIPREGPPTALPPDVPPGLPSTLLERRPDIRQAEQLLVAANANVGVAKAEFFPRLSLTGLFGNVSPELGDLFSQRQDLEHRRGPAGSPLPGRPDQAQPRGRHRAVGAGQDPIRSRRRERLRRGLERARGPDEARGDGEAAGAGGGRAPGGRAPRQHPLRLGPLGLLRGARGPAAALPGRDRPRPDAPRPARGGGRTSIGRSAAGGRPKSGWPDAP